MDPIFIKWNANKLLQSVADQTYSLGVKIKYDFLQGQNFEKDSAGCLIWFNFLWRSLLFSKENKYKSWTLILFLKVCYQIVKFWGSCSVYTTLFCLKIAILNLKYEFQNIIRRELQYEPLIPIEIHTIKLTNRVAPYTVALPNSVQPISGHRPICNQLHKQSRISNSSQRRLFTKT